MKTIVHYKNSPYLGKTETWIYGQIKHLKDFEPVVYCQGICNRDFFPLDRVSNINMTTNPLPGRWERLVNKIYSRVALVQALRRDHPDVVHAHYGPAGYEFLPFKRRFKLPMVTTFYGYDVNMLPTQDPRWRGRYRQLFAEGDLFLTEGSFMKQCLVNLGCDEKKVVVQHLGVDLEKLRFEPRILKTNEPVKILLAGSFREKKGIPYAIEAIGLFKQRRPGTQVKVTVIGDAGGQLREAQEKARIMAAVKKYKLEPDVNFLGYQQHPVFIDELYKNHIFLSPSVVAADGDTEGGAPVSIIEAAASGMLILSTKHCDIPEVVIDGETGVLVQERDSGALAERLEWLIDQCEAWGLMLLAGRRHIESQYSLLVQAASLDQIYHKFA